MPLSLTKPVVIPPSMALVSTFELLLKPQLPTSVTASIPNLAPLTRTILQGYFLSIANPNGIKIALRIIFTTQTPGLDPATVLAFLDTAGTNTTLTGNTTIASGIASTTNDITIDANDTCLLILQPNITDQKFFLASDYELRGYSEIFALEPNSLRSLAVLVTAEHRGTFYGLLDDKEFLNLGEVAYSLPLAGGGSLIHVDSAS